MARSPGRLPCCPILEALEDRQLLSLSPSPNLPAIAYNLTHGRLYDAKIATMAYEHYLGRFPEPAGLNAWVADLQAGVRDQQLEAGFLGSQEYIRNHGGNMPDWVRGMYQDLLGRAPADAEVKLWLQVISGGATVPQVAYGFAASHEREGNQITADYRQYLGRSPEPGIVSVWVQALTNGAGHEDVLAGFLASAEYLQKHGHGYAGWYASALQDAYAGVLVQDDWFRQNVQDAALRITAELASLDGQLDWQDMISLFREVEQEGPVTGAELQDLRQLIASSQNPAQMTLDGQPVTMLAAVSNLAAKVLGDNPANAFSQGSALGGLRVGSSPVQVEERVEKWLLGLDHPAAAASYSPVSGSLFAGAGPAYTDVRQGGKLGDCYLLAGFADAAARMPSAIESLFTYLGMRSDGASVWAVRLYVGGQPDYLTVDNLLPRGGFCYDEPAPAANGSTYSWTLWAPLLEKAFAQEFGGDDYANLDASQQPAGLGLAGITGQSTGWSSMDAGSPQPFTVFNPWGVNSGPFMAQFAADAAFMNDNFTYFWTTG